jgi:hypothetical protein
MLIPIVPFVAASILTGVAWAWARWIKRPTVAGVHLQIMCLDKEQVTRYFLEWLRQSIPLLGCCYNNICLQAFNVFSCKQLRTGAMVMTAAPSVVCWDSEEHTIMVAVAITALIIYVFGLPAFVLGSVMYARSKDKLRDPNVLLVLGMFYRKYGARLRCVALGSPTISVLCVDPYLPLVHHSRRKPLDPKAYPTEREARASCSNRALRCYNRP